MNRNSPVVPAVFPQELSNGIAFVGEAPGKAEELRGLPFVGAAGKLFDKMLARVELKREESLITNVFKRRPKDNNLRFFSVPKVELPSDYEFPAFSPGVYIDPKILNESLNVLQGELNIFKPKIVVALGNSAMVALTKTIGIGRYRGTLMDSTLVSGLKVIPTYHPASVLRTWKQLPIVLVDLVKAKREVNAGKKSRRTVHVAETMEDVESIMKSFNFAESLAFDVETLGDFITSIGFCCGALEAFVIPFYYQGSLWWKTLEVEFQVWKKVKVILEGPSIKIAQNGLFDVQRLLIYGIKVKHLTEDTMLFYHSYQPELPKDLGFLGSLYTDIGAWKQLRETGITTDED